MTTADHGVNDHLARLRLRMLNEKLSQERDRHSSVADSDEDDAVEKANIRLHQAMLKRDDLLGRLRKERNELDRRSLYSFKPAQKTDLRPRSYEGPRPPPSPYYRRPPSRHSLPDMSRQIIPQIQPITVQPQMLPPIQVQAGPAPIAPVAPMYSQPMQAPIAPVMYPETKWGKGDFMEMMMMQNAQMHQMVMNQMMLSTMPTPQNKHPQIIKVDSDGGGAPPPIVVSSNPQPQQGPVMAGGPGRGPAVHHHHYNYSPTPGMNNGMGAGQNNVTHLPPLDMRRRFPYPNEVEPLQQPRGYGGYGGYQGGYDSYGGGYY